MNLYALAEGISSVCPKFSFQNKKGPWKKFPMSTASMSW